ncbi:MAG: TlpA disulfide reductase family protein [Marmoricola sp.]
MARSRRTLALTTLLALVVALATAGCSSGLKTGNNNFVLGDGVITVLDGAKRVAPGPVSGTTLDGAKVTLSQYAGKVVVINVWGSWCAPCRSEAANLAKAAGELMPKGVVFLGINTRDTSADNARAFERTHAMPYPSIYDPGGESLLAFHHTLRPNAIPSTVVIDKDGRVAASIIGAVTTAQTLVDVVGEVEGK